MSSSKSILERLEQGIVVGDGGYCWQLERRGYVKAGPYTPEASVEHPEAVKQLHKEFLRAGSDVLQAFTFFASDDKLENSGVYANKQLTCAAINDASCKLAHEIAKTGDALVAGGLSQTPTYLNGGGKQAVQAEFKKQLDMFVKNEVDFVICEYFEFVEEMEWAIEECLKTGLVVAATMCIGPQGDSHGVPVGDCAVRMARAGAKIVGINCRFGPQTNLDALQMMKEALDAAGIKVYLMSQPTCFHSPDAGKDGYRSLPEFPFAMEPRVCTRWDIHAFARRAYEMGIRYIGGCCGFEAVHIRAIAEELAPERGKLPEASEKHAPWGEELKFHTAPWMRKRACRSYWENMNPASGRPFSPALSQMDKS